MQKMIKVRRWSHYRQPVFGFNFNRQRACIVAYSDATKNITRLRIEALKLSLKVVPVISCIFCRPTLFQMHYSHDSICSAVLFTPLADGQLVKRKVRHSQYIAAKQRLVRWSAVSKTTFRIGMNWLVCESQYRWVKSSA
jgi:hypothetical protein